MPNKQKVELYQFVNSKDFHIWFLSVAPFLKLRKNKTNKKTPPKNSVCIVLVRNPVTGSIRKRN